MTSYLFVHQNFPGQFPHLSSALAERGDTVVAIGEAKRLRQHGRPHPRITLVGYPEPKGAGAGIHHYLRTMEEHVRRGQAVFRAAQELVLKGFKPDVVIAHPGWGEALFLKDAFPKARHIHYLEYYYRAEHGDVGFDPEFPASLDDVCRVRVKSATQLVGLEYADAGLSPTAWQKSTYPACWHPTICQLHDGIDTAAVVPDAQASVTIGVDINPALPEPLVLTRKYEVLTYVARNLEPYRGFHTFMRSVPLILEQRPHAHIVIVGGDEVSYGKRPPQGTTYRELLQESWADDIDMSRIHFLGKLPYSSYLKVLQISSLHVYLTYPFVLSWSLLEAMSAQCLILASDTAPVRDVAADGTNCFLADFFDHRQLATRAADLLRNRKDLQEVRSNARRMVQAQFDLQGICLPAQLVFLKPA